MLIIAHISFSIHVHTKALFAVRSQALPSSKVKLNLDLARAGFTIGVVPSSPSTMAYASGGSAAAGSIVRVQTALGGIGDLVDKLQKALQTGDGHTAQQVAQQLSNLRANLEVGVRTDKAMEKEIR